MPGSELISKFGELGGLIGLIVGVLLIYVVYTHNQMSKRLTTLTDSLLEIVKINSVVLAENHEDKMVIAAALDKRQCMAGEGLKEKLEELSKHREKARQDAVAAKSSAA